MIRVSSWEESGNKHINLTAVPSPKPYHKTIARLVGKYVSHNSSVLDIGCGLGQISFLIKEKNPRLPVYVADAYQQCIDMTRKCVDVSGYYLLDERNFSLEEVDKDFDVVIMSHVLEHMLDPVGAIRKSLDVTKKDGYLILAVPNPSRPTVLLTNVLRKHYVNRGHVVSWDRSHWINFLEGILNLEVVEYASDSVIIFPSRMKTFLPLLTNFEVFLAKVLPWWSFSNIAVIKKSGGTETF